MAAVDEVHPVAPVVAARRCPVRCGRALHEGRLADRAEAGGREREHAEDGCDQDARRQPLSSSPPHSLLSIASPRDGGVAAAGAAATPPRYLRSAPPPRTARPRAEDLLPSPQCR